MSVEEIDSNEFSRLFEKPYIPYNSVQFNLLNSYKCDELRFLLFHDERINLGLIAGIKDKGLYSPFSAPFSSFLFQNQNANTSSILKAISLLDEYSENHNFKSVKFTLPPYFYNENIISKLIFSFSRRGYSAIVDDNHFFYTKDFIKYDNGSIKKGVRYNIKVAINAGLVFKKANSVDEYKIAFDVIERSKDCKGYPLNMTFNQIVEMQGLVDIDFFIVYHMDNPIASAIGYNYKCGIAQIIYWGDLPDFKCFYPMNFLAMNIFRFYAEKKIDIIDLGNSSKNGVPNFGLSNFKEIIGCTTTPKFTFFKNFLNSGNTQLTK